MLKKTWFAFQQDPWRYLLIFLCIGFGLLQFFGLLNKFEPDKIIGLILAFFGFISLSTLKLLRKTQSIAEFTVSNSSNLVFKKPPESFSDIIADAKEFWVCGVSASGFIEDYNEELAMRISRRRKTIFVFVNPDSIALEMVSMRDQTATDKNPVTEYQKARINASIDKLKGFSNKNGDGAEIWLTPYPIDCEYIYVDYGNYQTIFIRHFPYKTSFGGELRLSIDVKNAEFFSCYKKHLRNIREHATEVV